MLFTSPSFALLVAVTFALFYLPALRRWQTGILILSSFVFYGLNQISYLGLLLISITLNALTSYLIFYADSERKAKIVAASGLAINLGILAYFKYAGLLGRMLPESMMAEGGPAHFLLMVTLPVGISFFTFEGISLVVDTFRIRGSGDLFGAKLNSPRDHLVSTTLFVSFFPHLVAGPILKAHDFYPQIKEKHLSGIDWEFCFRRMIVGYFLKMVIADNLKEHTYWIQYPYFVGQSSAELVMMLLGYSMQIFADFAGYSLIAIGIAGLFGYRLPENFDFPYISKSFSEFWRRWHISLSSWLREYLYFPLGGNRKGTTRTYFNLFIVMFLGGLWHGAAWSYAVWGSVHGLALAIERFFTSAKAKDHRDSFIAATLKILLVFTVVTLAWLLFKLPNFSHAMMYLKEMGLHWDKPAKFERMYNLIVFSLPVVLYHLAYLLKGKVNLPTRILAPVAYGVMLFFIIVNSGSTGEFIYFQF